MQLKSHFFPAQMISEIKELSGETQNPVVEEVASPTIEEETQHAGPGSTGSNAYRVILYNDDWHTQDQVATQLQKATYCSFEEAMAVIWAVELRGRAVCFHGSRDECHRVTRVLREIRLQCEVDCD